MHIGLVYVTEMLGREREKVVGRRSDVAGASVLTRESMRAGNYRVMANTRCVAVSAAPLSFCSFCCVGK